MTDAPFTPTDRCLTPDALTMTTHEQDQTSPQSPTSTPAPLGPPAGAGAVAVRSVVAWCPHQRRGARALPKHVVGPYHLVPQHPEGGWEAFTLCGASISFVSAADARHWKLAPAGTEATCPKCLAKIATPAPSVPAAPVDARADETDPGRLAALEAENLTLRRLLWWRHGCESPALYGDDGEMQCGACCIDFRRQPADEIDAAWVRRALAALAPAPGEATKGEVGRG